MLILIIHESTGLDYSDRVRKKTLGSSNWSFSLKQRKKNVQKTHYLRNLIILFAVIDGLLCFLHVSSKIFLQYIHYFTLSDRNISKRISVSFDFTHYDFLKFFLLFLFKYNLLLSLLTFAHVRIFYIILYTWKWKWDLHLTSYFR